VCAGELDASEARRIFAQFQVHLAEPRYHVVPIGVAEYALARDWIAGLAVPLRVLDALHLAAAFAHTLRLLTADRALTRAAGQLGVEQRLIA